MTWLADLLRLGIEVYRDFSRTQTKPEETSLKSAGVGQRVLYRSPDGEVTTATIAAVHGADVATLAIDGGASVVAARGTPGWEPL